MGTIAVTGSASGMGASTSARLAKEGHRVIGVDLKDAEVVADLSTADGRWAAIEGVNEACDGVLDGLVTFAGLAGKPGRPGGLLVAVNYFGTVELLEGLRPLLAAGTNAAAVAISSNSTTSQPGFPLSLVEACLAGDERAAAALADEVPRPRPPSPAGSAATRPSPSGSAKGSTSTPSRPASSRHP